MPDKEPAARGRRLADLLGLTESGQQILRNSRRYMLLMLSGGVFLLLLGLSSMILAITSFSSGKSDYWHLIFAVVSFAVAISCIGGWVRFRNRNSSPRQ